MEKEIMPTTSLSIPLPRTITTALQRLQDSTLHGIELTVVYEADQPDLMPFLKALAEGNDEQARIEMGNALALHPWLFAHPYIHDLLAGIWASPDITEATRVLWLTTAGKHFSQALTFHDVELKKPGSMPPGPRIACFPKLPETDCTFPTDESLRERDRAWAFVALYEELHQGLETGLCDGTTWRELTELFRVNPKSAVDQLMEDLKAFFGKYVDRHSLLFEPISDTQWSAIAQQGLNEVIKGKSPRREISAQLFARLQLPPFDIARKAGKTIESEFILKTLESLRRHLGEETIELIRYGVASRLQRE
jgi:hypothetical protein